VPGSKWPWFLDSLKAGSMVAFDTRTAVPSEWSLKPEDTRGLVFWTKNPANIIDSYDLLRPYSVKAHITVTGWAEVEHGVPHYFEVARRARSLADLIGRANIFWRFSPVPLVDDVVDRFERIAHMLRHTVGQVYLSFLQTNDLLPETRTPTEKVRLLIEMADVGRMYGIRLVLCNDDNDLLHVTGLTQNLTGGVCVPPEDFEQPGLALPTAEGCGCCHMVDPFTINEQCQLGCKYCYSADRSLSPKRRNTTRSLPVVR
jgi:hypothetical protein